MLKYDEQKITDEFTGKIGEAIRKLQITLPKQLSDEECGAIELLVKEYFKYSYETEKAIGVCTLSGLIKKAVSDVKNGYADDAEPKIENEEVKSSLERMKNIIESSQILSNTEKVDENIPFLRLVIFGYGIRILNHEHKLLYGTFNSKEMNNRIEDYHVKSHAQVMRDTAILEKECSSDRENDD